MAPSVLLTRRQVLVKGIVGMAGLMGAPGARTAAVSAAASAAPAAATAAGAAGTLTIGGDLTVNRLGFGAMRITGPGIWGEPKDPAEARTVLRRAVELGINFIDTADAYGPRVSEQLIAEALYPYPPRLVIATKGGLTRPGADQWIADGRPEHLREACEDSLRRLRLESIDLYQFHRIDPYVALEYSIEALAELQRAGKIRHIGVSNFNASELARARRIAPIVSVQNRYNLTDRRSDEVLGVCARDGLAFIPWAPIAGGSTDRLESRASQAVEEVARAHDVSVLQIAIAWLLAKSPAMLPIPGTSSVAHLEQNVAAASVRLSGAELAAIG
jgi:pyridoxine 4-dehydrogenase